MKSTGIVRRVDKLDRIVIPKELCRILEIEAKTPIEIFLDGTRIVLKKHNEGKLPGISKGGLGIVRRVDDLDRIVIPKEVCNKLNIAPKDALEIFVDEDKLVLGKYEPACVFCNEADNVARFKGKPVCEKCIRELVKELKNK